MSRKTGKEKFFPTSGDVPFGNITWVLDNLSKNELEDYDKRNVQATELMTFVQRMTETGWRMSVKWDDKSKAQQVSFVQSRYEFPNAGFAFSSRSDDWLDAIGLCWYKFTVVSEGVL